MGKLFDGYKTKIAAVLAAVIGVAQAGGFLSPEVAQALLSLAAALGLYGLRDAMDKK